MGITAPRNTLSHQLARPLCVRRDVSGVHCNGVQVRVAHRLETYNQSPVTPETEALRFYLLQHAMAEVRLQRDEMEPLGEMVAVPELYHSQINELAQRMFVYLLLICTRESRHPAGSSSYFKKLLHKFSPEITEFHQKIHKTNSSTAVQGFLDGAPDATIGVYCDHLVWVFENGKFGSSYGGPKWAVIARVLRDFVYGELSAEMMLDTAFTLAHNGGPIFNKGLGFNMYNGHILYTILDVQASGQIPQLIAHGVPGQFNVPSEILKLHGKCVDALGPEKLTGEICWWRVEKDGKHQYPKFKKNQKAKPAWVAEEEAAAQKKLDEAELQKATLYYTVDATGAQVEKESRSDKA